jgi:hypothetical protein
VKTLLIQQRGIPRVTGTYVTHKLVSLIVDLILDTSSNLLCFQKVKLENKKEKNNHFKNEIFPHSTNDE